MKRCITTSSEQYKLAFAVSLGGMLEFYDFLIYGLMASYIAEHFFPADDQFLAILGTFATFAVGYFARPVGGLVFGHYGDRYGRKATFTFSIFLMALSTVLIGLLPGHVTIGAWATVLLVLLRLLQGFSLGGEIPGAITYLSESAPERQGLVLGILFLALMLGVAFGTFVHGALAFYLGPEKMVAWGWRLPFLLGGVLGGISYIIRRRFHESGFFLALNQARQRSQVPLKELINYHWRGLLFAVAAMAVCGATVTVYGIYMPGYLSSILDYSKGEVARHTALAFLIHAPIPLIGGLCYDLVNRKLLLAVLALLIAILAWPTFHYFSSEQAELKTILMICAMYTGIAAGLLPPLMIHCFPTEVRFTGVAVAYNAGFALFGGVAPFLSTVLVEDLGPASGPAVYMVVIATFSLSSLFISWPAKADNENTS